MTDKTDSKEREAQAAETWLRDRYGAYRGHFAWRELEEAFLAGRASLAVSAGSGPLMGKPQEMPDLSALTERGAKAWAAVDAQGLREGVASVAASAPAPSGHIKEPYTVAEIKAKIASNDYSAELLLQHAMLHLDRLAANAGSEPVAWRYVDARGHFRYVGYKPSRDMAAEYPLLKPIRLYLHPSPPEGMVGGWIALPGTLPEPGVPVLLDIGKKYPIRAMWAAKHTVEAADDDTDWGEYDEATETYYCPEGWYEWNEHEDTNWAVSATPRAWATLPPTSSADSSKGE